MTDTDRIANSFSSKATLEVGGDRYEIHRLDALAGLCDLSKVPYSVKLLLENLLRNEDGAEVTAADIAAIQREAVLALVRDMNAYTRFVAKPMRGHGNVTGADNVVSWQTGYPFGVNLSRGYPRFNPGEYTTADTLARGEADAAMIIASDPMANFSQAARTRLAAIPYIALDPKETPTTRCIGWTTCRFRCGPHSIRPTPATSMSFRNWSAASSNSRRSCGSDESARYLFVSRVHFGCHGCSARAVPVATIHERHARGTHDSIVS